KQAAKDAIDKAASAAKDAINKDPKLTEEQKQAAKDAIDKAASAAKDAVDKAKTPDEVNQAKENGLAEIGKVVPNSTLDKQKEDAKKEVDDAAAAAKDKIDKDPNLTDKQKEDAKKEVDNAAANAKDEIDKAKTPDEVNKAKDKGTANIDKQVPSNNTSGGNGNSGNNNSGGNGGNTNPGNTNSNPDKTLEDQKKAADKAIDDAVSAAKDKINKDPNLTDKQKAEANKAIDDAAAKAKDAISKAKTPEELKQILNNAIAEINKNIPSQGNNKPKAIEKRLNHNAYFYNKQGKRANLLVAKSGSIISTYGTEKINGREFYITDNGLYVAVNNVISNKRRLKRNAFVYNLYGKRVGITLLKKNSEIGTYGDPVKIKGIAYYIIGQNRYVKATNFAFITIEANNILADGVASNAEVHHNAYIYDENGNRLNKLILKAGSRITTGESRTISGQKYVAIAEGQYVVSDNITGTDRKLKHKSYVYNQYGQRISRKALKKNSAVQTYGNAISIRGNEYYAVGQNKFIKRSNFK
ncbi:MAG: SLAP domain-containing protein, partial [Lactobacillus sp.]|nr:SLAP domain-containing protein [Lactobacillus sp.]